jgi:predicted GNAT family acetyltransferase
MDYLEIPLDINEAGHRFEIMIDELLAFINYMKKGDKIHLIHTEVPWQLQGKGLAAALVEKPLRYIEDIIIN